MIEKYGRGAAVATTPLTTLGILLEGMTRKSNLCGDAKGMQVFVIF